MLFFLHTLLNIDGKRCQGDSGDLGGGVRGRLAGGTLPQRSSVTETVRLMTGDEALAGMLSRRIAGNPPEGVQPLDGDELTVRKWLRVGPSFRLIGGAGPSDATKRDPIDLLSSDCSNCESVCLLLAPTGEDMVLIADTKANIACYHRPFSQFCIFSASYPKANIRIIRSITLAKLLIQAVIDFMSRNEECDFNAQKKAS